MTHVNCLWSEQKQELAASLGDDAHRDKSEITFNKTSKCLFPEVEVKLSLGTTESSD